jgi:hypothetical protein
MKAVEHLQKILEKQEAKLEIRNRRAYRLSEWSESNLSERRLLGEEIESLKEAIKFLEGKKK